MYKRCLSPCFCDCKLVNGHVSVPAWQVAAPEGASEEEVGVPLALARGAQARTLSRMLDHLFEYPLVVCPLMTGSSTR